MTRRFFFACLCQHMATRVQSIWLSRLLGLLGRAKYGIAGSVLLYHLESDMRALFPHSDHFASIQRKLHRLSTLFRVMHVLVFLSYFLVGVPLLLSNALLFVQLGAVRKALLCLFAILFNFLFELVFMKWVPKVSERDGSIPSLLTHALLVCFSLFCLFQIRHLVSP
ncbi:hypothetical protein [Candidatus Similichlamydia laticola]|nr:hypothetical protein [Candidatus Similichlamydia laticola]